jgi:tRNA(Ile)-lysidine synthase
LTGTASVSFTPSGLHQALAACIGNLAGRHLCVAYSGGVDSTALLIGLCEIRDGLALAGLRALHVDHGLHPDSGRWAGWAQAAATGHGLACEVLRVAVMDGGGESPEAAARAARYRALEDALMQGEIILTAHQRDDQAETLLLQLLRGAGVAGLAAMPPIKRFGRGWLARPLLGVDRAELEWFLRDRGQAWLSDPGNVTSRYDRNYLRAEIMPQLRQRWPGANRTLARSAAHCAEAAGLLTDLAVADHARAGGDGRLSRIVLRSLTPPRQRNLLRHWIRRHGHPPPGTQQLEEFRQAVAGGTKPTGPLLRWQGLELRCYRNWVYLTPEWQDPGPRGWRDWQLGSPLALGPGLGSLTAQRSHGGGLDEARLAGARIRVGFRRGGECLRPRQGGPRRRLSRLFQEAGIVPWMRARVPLVYVDGELAAVAHLWIAAEFRARQDAAGWVLDWQNPPALH